MPYIVNVTLCSFTNRCKVRNINSWSISVSGGDFDSSHDLFVFVLEKEKTDKNQHKVCAFIFILLFQNCFHCAETTLALKTSINILQTKVNTNKQKVNTLAVLYENKPKQKDKPQKKSTLQRMKNLFKFTKNTETPPVPTRRYLEDDDFMLDNFDGQPAIPPRTSDMETEQVSVRSQRSDDEPAIPPRSYLLDNAFVQGLEAFVAEVSGKDEPDLGDEDKIYQPLIPPRRYEQNSQDDSDVYQALTSNRLKRDSTAEMAYQTKETQFATDSESHYQPLVKRAEQSVYEMVVVGASKDDENENIETVPNNSEGHYQPLMKREEPSDYQTISTCISRGQTLTSSLVVESNINSEEGHYQALVRKQEENPYHSLTLDTVV